MGRWLDKSLTKAEDFLAIIAGVLVIVSMLTIVLEVVTRYFTGHSFVWVQEYNEYLLLYIPFLAGAWLLRHNGHVVISLIDNITTKGVSRILNRLVATLGVITMAILIYYSSIVTLELFQKGVTSTTVLRTPQVYVYFVIPLGCLFLFLEFIRIFIRSFKKVDLE